MKKLTKAQEDVLVHKGTERPFTGALLHNTEKGDYMCAKCGNLLFHSEKKFDSGSGWPSFSAAATGGVELQNDDSLGNRRTEVVCKKCSSHLGHVFNDGPLPSGKRFCINSVALAFKKK